jgi:uncharacterized protein YggE
MPRTGKIWALALLIAGVLPLFPWAAAGQECPEPGPVVMVLGRGEVLCPADQGEVEIGVISRALIAQEAAEKNAAVMSRVLAAVKAKLGPQDRLATETYRVSPQYQWDPKEKVNRFKGFEAANRLAVVVHDISGLGAILDAAIQAGANQIFGPRFALKDPADAWRQAQVAAYRDAAAQAAALAKAAGMILGTLIKMNAGGPPAPLPEALALRAADTAVPLEPGQIRIQAQVACTFLLDPGP